MFLQTNITAKPFLALVQFELLFELFVLLAHVLEPILNVILLQAHRFKLLKERSFPVEQGHLPTY